MKLTLKVKLYVTQDQHIVLDRMAFASTKLWNIANWERRQVWEGTGKIPNYYEQEAVLKNNPWHKRLPHHSAQAVLQKLDHSYRSWFKLRKTDQTARPPGFRPKESLSIITFKESAFRVEGDKIRLTIPQKVKEELYYIESFLILPFQSYKSLEGKPKLIEVMYSGEAWFAHIVQEVQAPELLPDTNAMGIDLGIVNMAACVTEEGKAEIIDGGQIASVWRYFNKQIGKIQKRVMGRGKRWSEGLTEISKKRSIQTKHILHAATNRILEYAINENINTIVIGDLKNILKKKNGDSRNFGIANQKLHSWNFNQFTQMLSYKAQRAGISVKKVSERNSSRTCSVCGIVDKKSRMHRGLYRCRHCGTELNADVNGARNILKTYLESVSRPVVAELAQPSVRKWNSQKFC
ncbi:MAG: transposase [Candidatus Methanoperedens nitroreducens]|uniref:Transposase n=1 Tax=Candidatus Methanoperedens nitratireducens TaxID=1392998 RepID=A0A0P8A0A7_9EURY|nr:MAG: transposase [Candidatus Methanoperedens sp. BLZ1]